VVLVAQSLAGFTLPLVCKKVRVAMLVLVNAMIPKPGETPGEWWGNTGHGEAKRLQNVRDDRRADAPFDPLIDFFHDVPQPVVDNAWAQGEPRQSDTVFGSRCTFKAWPAVPSRVLVGRDDRFFPAEFQRRVARERLGIAADEMLGGHLVALSQPAELSTRLVAYIATRRLGAVPKSRGMSESRYVALLRGINVGGRNIIKMADLRGGFEEMGLTEVTTYIESGNVMFSSKQASKAKLTEMIEQALRHAFRYDSRVIVISASELERVVAQAPHGFGKNTGRYRYDVLFVKEPLRTREAFEQVTTKPGVDAAHAGDHALYVRRLISRPRRVT